MATTPRKPLLVLSLLAGCAPREIDTAPDLDIGAALAWRSASPVNLAIDRFIESGFFFWGAYQRSGPLTVVEDGVASSWQALVLVSHVTGVVEPGPCRPDGGVGMYVWRPLPDSTGIDAILLVLPRLDDLDGASFGPTQSCPFMTATFSGPYLGRSRWSNGRLVPDRYRMAIAGQAHVGVIGGPGGGRCPFAPGPAWSAPCQEINVGVTIQATLTAVDERGQPTGAHHSLAIGPNAVPGLRQFTRCQFTGCGVPPRRVALPPRLSYPGDYLFADNDRYRGIWRSDSVLRPIVTVRFKSTLPDTAIETTVTRWGADVIGRGPAGDLWLRVPDPGPGPGAAGRMIDRLSGERGVESVFPFRAGSRHLAVAPGRIRASLRAAPTNGVSGFACLGLVLPTIVSDPGPWCRRADSRGVAVFDSLEAFDHRLYAVCAAGADAPVITDSVAVRVRPEETTDVRLRLGGPEAGGGLCGARRP